MSYLTFDGLLIIIRQKRHTLDQHTGYLASFSCTVICVRAKKKPVGNLACLDFQKFRFLFLHSCLGDDCIQFNPACAIVTFFLRLAEDGQLRIECDSWYARRSCQSANQFSKQCFSSDISWCNMACALGSSQRSISNRHQRQDNYVSH